MESEILIVDEVLAVGDAEFQKKCLGKMGEVSKGEGRTVLFVSHNMGAISQLCSTCMVLDRGQKICYADTAEALNVYRDNNSSQNVEYNSKNKTVIVITMNDKWRIVIYNFKLTNLMNAIYLCHFRLMNKGRDFIISSY